MLKKIFPKAGAVNFGYSLSKRECHLAETGHCPIDNIDVDDIKPLSKFEPLEENNEGYCPQLAAILSYPDTPLSERVNRFYPIEIYEFEDGESILTGGRHRYCIAMHLNERGANISVPALVQKGTRPKK